MDHSELIAELSEIEKMTPAERIALARLLISGRLEERPEMDHSELIAELSEIEKMTPAERIALAR
ncbi:hypothetical protein Tcan_15797 [Toxocara canis]|uniref:Uncharacterized protein n=1 Tax=Toxocara canis TaxID=6265 RepID=A0A0B2V2D3_TOXCA|nr:hypothetical protein Tcan_15797 [Toxocara canis]